MGKTSMGKKVAPRPAKPSISAAVHAPQTAKRPGTVKRSFTISKDIDDRAHELVGSRGYSALVNEALREKIQYASVKQFVAEYEAEHGAIPKAEREAARKKIRDAGLV